MDIRHAGNGRVLLHRILQRVLSVLRADLPDQLIPAVRQFVVPIAGLVFPIAQNNSPLKFILIMTPMYWGIVVFYTVVIQKIKLKF